MKKPKAIPIHNGMPLRGNVIEVFEDTYAEQFADEDEILVNRQPMLFGDIFIFDGMSYEEQIRNAKVFAKWFDKYAKWLETKSLMEDPNI